MKLSISVSEINSKNLSRHMDVLLNVEAVTSPHHLKELRHLYDLIESHVRSLLWNSALISRVEQTPLRDAEKLTKIAGV